MKNKKVIILSIVIVVLLAGYIKACAYLPITGTVVDAETGKPIEGAVVLVEWTIKKGIGDKHTESVKVAEVLTDKDGKFDLPGCYRPFVESPDLTIYKRGYVAWSSRWIFPDMQNRIDFHWGGNIIKLNQFNEKYSYASHVNFISLSINESLNSELKSAIEKAYGWESKMANKEREQRRR